MRKSRTFGSARGTPCKGRIYSTMMEILLLLFVIALGIAVIGAAVYHGTRRGEDCHGYPYNCPACRHAAECIIEIGRKKDDA